MLAYGMRHTAAQSRQRWLVITLVTLLSLALAACGSSGTDASTSNAPVEGKPGVEGQTQTSEGGQVTVKVTWLGLSAGPVFRVVIDTHAVDLDGYDLRQLAVLRAEGGREVRPTGWDAPKGGHHREGTLTFPLTAGDGSLVLTPGTQTMELVIRDVAGVSERVFRWTVEAS